MMSYPSLTSGSGDRERQQSETARQIYFLHNLDQNQALVLQKFLLWGEAHQTLCCESKETSRKKRKTNFFFPSFSIDYIKIVGLFVCLFLFLKNWKVCTWAFCSDSSVIPNCAFLTMFSLGQIKTVVQQMLILYLLFSPGQ